MRIEEADDIYNTAHLILDTLNAVYLEHADLAEPLPTRQFVVAGSPGSHPHDCEQVVVYVGQTYIGEPGNPTDSPVHCYNAPITGVFHVEIVRNTLPDVPTASGRGSQRKYSGPLTPEQENAIAKMQMIDMRLMLHAGLTTGDETATGSVADVASGAESGGYQAMTMTVMMGLI